MPRGLADDAIHKLLVERDPLAGPALASQPTLSKFENAVSWHELRETAHVLADTVTEQQRRRRKGKPCRSRSTWIPRSRACSSSTRSATCPSTGPAPIPPFSPSADATSGVR